ncbi:hypothetical protein ACWC09_28075 [Streptomyces sp. NPDC001617]
MWDTPLPGTLPVLVRVELTGNWGRDITPFSKKPYEEEVLLLPGARLGIEARTVYSDEEGDFEHIRVREVPPPSAELRRFAVTFGKLGERAAEGLWVEAARVTAEHNPFRLTVAEGPGSLLERDSEQYWATMRVAQELHKNEGAPDRLERAVEVARALATERGVDASRRPGLRGGAVDTQASSSRAVPEAAPERAAGTSAGPARLEAIAEHEDITLPGTGHVIRVDVESGQLLPVVSVGTGTGAGTGVRVEPTGDGGLVVHVEGRPEGPVTWHYDADRVLESMEGPLTVYRGNPLSGQRVRLRFAPEGSVREVRLVPQIAGTGLHADVPRGEAATRLSGGFRVTDLRTSTEYYFDRAARQVRAPEPVIRHISFDAGSSRPSAEALRAIDALAASTAQEGVAAFEQGGPLPVVSVSGHGNGTRLGRPHYGRAVQRGQERAEAVADAFQESLRRHLEAAGAPPELQAAHFNVVPTSRGREFPAGTSVADGPAAHRRAVITVSHPERTPADRRTAEEARDVEMPPAVSEEVRAAQEASASEQAQTADGTRVLEQEPVADDTRTREEAPTPDRTTAEEPPVAEVPWYVDRGALGEVTVHDAAALDDDLAQRWADRVAFEVTRPGDGTELIQGIYDAVRGLLVGAPAVGTAEHDSEEEHAGTPVAAWDRALQRGLMVVAGDHVVWVRPVLKQLAPAPVDPHADAAVREYKVSFAGQSSTNKTAIERPHGLDIVPLTVLSVAKGGGSLLPVIPLVGGQWSRAQATELERTVVAGRKVFVKDTLRFLSGGVHLRVFVDGEPRPYVTGDERLVVPAQVTVELPSDFTKPGGPRLETVDEPGPRGTGVARPHHAREVINAVDLVPVAAQLQRRLRSAGLPAEAVRQIAETVLARLNEKSARNRSRHLLGNGVVVNRVDVRAGGRAFRGSFSVQASIHDLQYLGDTPDISVREDSGVGITVARSRTDKGRLSVGVASAGGKDGAVRFMPSGALTYDRTREAGHGLAEVAMSHTVLNAASEQARYRAGLRVTVKVVSDTHTIAPVEHVVDAEIGVPGREAADFEKRLLGEDAPPLRQEALSLDGPVDAAPNVARLLTLAADHGVGLPESAYQRPARLDAPLPQPHPREPFALASRLGQGFGMAIALPGAELVLPQIRTVLATLHRQRTGGRKAPDWSKAEDDLATWFDRPALESDLPRLLAGVTHDIAVSGRTYTVSVGARLLERVHGRTDVDAYPMIVNARALESAATTGSRATSWNAEFQLGARLAVKVKKLLRLQVGNVGLSIGGGLSRSSEFAGAAKSYRRTETVGSVDEHVYNLVYELSVRSSGHSPHRWWIDRPGDAVARIVVPHQHVPAQPVTHDEAREAGRVEVPAEAAQPTTAFLHGGVAGVFPTFLTPRDLPLAAARLLQQADGLDGDWLEDWANWPAALNRTFASTELAAHFAELVGPGLLVDLPTTDGGWHHMLRVRMVVTEPRHLTVHAGRGEEVEVEQYSQGQAQHETSRGKEGSAGLTAGAGLRFEIGDKAHSPHAKVAAIGKANWEWGRSREESTATGPVGITRATYGGTTHTYRADPVFEITVFRWKSIGLFDRLSGSGRHMTALTQTVRVAGGLEILVPERRIADLGLPTPTDVTVAPHEPTGHVDPALLPGVGHAEVLHADGVLELMKQWLTGQGLVKDRGDEYRPNLLVRELDRSFSSEALLSQYSVLTGGGVSRWLAVPSAFGARYLWVQVTAQVGRPRQQLDRPDVRLTLRNQAVRETGTTKGTSFGWQAALVGRALMGNHVHFGPEVEAGYRQGTEVGHEKTEKEMEIYRAQTREGSVEFGHEVTFHVRMGLSYELPDALRAPLGLVRGAALTVAGWTGYRQAAGDWWQAHETFVRRFPEPEDTDAGTVRGDVRLLVPGHLVTTGEQPPAPARAVGTDPVWEPSAVGRPQTSTSTTPESLLERLLKDGHPWALPAHAAVHKWAALAAAPSRVQRENLEAAAPETWNAPGPEIVAGVAYAHHTGENMLRAGFEKLLKHQYEVPVGKRLVTVGIDVRSVTRIGPADPAVFKARHYTQAHESEKDPVKESSGWYVGVGLESANDPEQGPRVINRDPYSYGWDRSQETSGEAEDVNEANRERARQPYFYYKATLGLVLTGRHGQLRVTVPDGLYLMLPSDANLDEWLRPTEPPALVPIEEEPVSEPLDISGDTGHATSAAPGEGTRRDDTVQAVALGSGRIGETTVTIRRRDGVPTGEHWRIDHSTGTASRIDTTGTPVVGPHGFVTIGTSPTGALRLTSRQQPDVVLFEQEPLGGGHLVQVDRSAAGELGWTEFDAAGNQVAHGTRTWDARTRTFHDTPSSLQPSVTLLAVRTYHPTADGGVVRARQGADGTWTWTRFDADGVELLSGTRRWNWINPGYKDFHTDPRTGRETVFQRNHQAWPFSVEVDAPAEQAGERAVSPDSEQRSSGTHSTQSSEEPVEEQFSMGGLFSSRPLQEGRGDTGAASFASSPQEGTDRESAVGGPAAQGGLGIEMWRLISDPSWVADYDPALERRFRRIVDKAGRWNQANIAETSRSAAAPGVSMDRSAAPLEAIERVADFDEGMAEVLQLTEETAATLRQWGLPAHVMDADLAAVRADAHQNLLTAAQEALQEYLGSDSPDSGSRVGEFTVMPGDADGHVVVHEPTGLRMEYDGDGDLVYQESVPVGQPTGLRVGIREDFEDMVTTHELLGSEEVIDGRTVSNAETVDEKGVVRLPVDGASYVITDRDGLSVRYQLDGSPIGRADTSPPGEADVLADDTSGVPQHIPEVPTTEVFPAGLVRLERKRPRVLPTVYEEDEEDEEDEEQDREPSAEAEPGAAQGVVAARAETSAPEAPRTQSPMADEALPQPQQPESVHAELSDGTGPEISRPDLYGADAVVDTETETPTPEQAPDRAAEPAVRVVEGPLHGASQPAGYRLRRTDTAATGTSPASSRLDLVDAAGEVVPDRTVLPREGGGFVVRGPEGNLFLDSRGGFEYRELELPGVDHVVRLREPVGIEGSLELLDREGVPVEGGRLARFPDGLTVTVPLAGPFEGTVAQWRLDTSGVLVRQVLPRLGRPAGDEVSGRGKAPMDAAEAPSFATETEEHPGLAAGASTAHADLSEQQADPVFSQEELSGGHDTTDMVEQDDADVQEVPQRPVDVAGTGEDVPVSPDTTATRDEREPEHLTEPAVMEQQEAVPTHKDSPQPDAAEDESPHEEVGNDEVDGEEDDPEFAAAFRLFQERTQRAQASEAVGEPRREQLSVAGPDNPTTPLTRVLTSEDPEYARTVAALNEDRAGFLGRLTQRPASQPVRPAERQEAPSDAASAADMERLAFQREAERFERRLGSYLAQRPEAQRQVATLARLAWEKADPEQRHKFGVGSEQEYAVGAVGRNLEALEEVAYHGNIREQMVFLYVGMKADVMAGLDRWVEPTAKQLGERRELWQEAFPDVLEPRHVDYPSAVPLSDRERAWTDDGEAWLGGEQLHAARHLPVDEQGLPTTYDEQTLFSGPHATAQQSGGLIMSGISGSTWSLLDLAARANIAWDAGIDLRWFRLAVVGNMLASGHHTLHEVLQAAERWADTAEHLPNGAELGFEYHDNWERYRHLGPLTEQELRDHVADDGLFPDELVRGPGVTAYDPVDDARQALAAHLGEPTGRRLSRRSRRREAPTEPGPGQDFTVTRTANGHEVVHLPTGLVTRFRGERHEVAYHEVTPGFGPAELRGSKVAVHHDRQAGGQIAKGFELLGDPRATARFTVEEAPRELRDGRMAEFSVRDGVSGRRLHYFADGRPVAGDQPLAENLGFLRFDLFRPGGQPRLLGPDRAPSRLPLRAELLGHETVALVPTTPLAEPRERIVVNSRNGHVLEETFAARAADSAPNGRYWRHDRTGGNTVLIDGTGHEVSRVGLDDADAVAVRETRVAGQTDAGSDAAQQATATGVGRTLSEVFARADQEDALGLGDTPLDPAELARRARVERPRVTGEFDGFDVRTAIVRMVGLAAADRGTYGMIDTAFSDEQLRENFHRALDGGYSVDLSARANGGPQVVVEAVGLGTPHTITSGTGDLGFSRTQTVEDRSSSVMRQAPILEPRAGRVPLPFFQIAAKIAGLINVRDTNLSAQTRRDVTTEVVETGVPVTRAGHTVAYRVVVRKPGRWPWSKARTQEDIVHVPLTLDWPRPAQNAAARHDGAQSAQLRTEEVLHAEFTGVGPGVLEAVVDELGSAFKVNDPAARELRAWLDQLPGHAPQLFGGQVLRRSFPFKGRWGRTQVAVAIAKNVVVRDLPEAVGTVTRTHEISEASTSGQGLTRRWGGGLTLGFGNTAHATGVIGPVFLGYGLTKNVTDVSDTRTYAEAETHRGLIHKRRVEFALVVRVGGPDGSAQQVDGGVATLWTRERDAAALGDDIGNTVSAETDEAATPRSVPEPPDASRFTAPDRLDSAYRLSDRTVENIAGQVLHRLDAEGLLDAAVLTEAATHFRAFLREHVRELANGGDGVRFPLSAWRSGAPDVFVRGVLRPAHGRYLGDAHITLTGSVTASHAQNTAVTKRQDRTVGVAGAGTRVQGDEVELLGAGLAYKSNEVVTHEVLQRLGSVREVGGGTEVHRFGFDVDFEVRVGGRWSAPGEVARWREADRAAGYAATTIPGHVEVVVPERAVVPLAGPSERSAGSSAQVWQEGPAPAPDQREGHLPAGYQLDALKPVPQLQGTVAGMLATPRGTKWRELYRRPLLGSAPAAFDQHQGRNWLERRPEEINERNASLDVLENFTGPAARMAGFERVVAFKDTVRLKSHNRAGLAGSRELFARVDLSARLGDPRVVAVDEEHRFGGTRFGEVERTAGGQQGWAVRLKVDGGVLAPVEELLTYFGGYAAGVVTYGRTDGTSAVRGAKDVSAGDWTERGYLVSFDATYEVRAAKGRAWQDITSLTHGTPVEERSRWVRVPDAVTLWVPASEIHRVGELTESDLGKLAAQDAERYLAAADVAAVDAGSQAVADTPVEEPPAPAETDDTPVKESPEPDVSAVRAPANTGRGSGRVELYRLEAGGELVQQIARRLDEWSVQKGRAGRSWLDLAYQVLGRPALQEAGPARVAKFDRINDRLVHDVLGPTLPASGFGTVIEEMLNGGRSVFLEGDTPFGKVEQLVVLRARLGEGRYHATLSHRTSRDGLETTERKADSTESGWSALWGLYAFAYPGTTRRPAAALLAGPAGVHSWTTQWEVSQQHTESVTSSGAGEGVQFLHDLLLTMDVYPYARPGHYSKYLPDWMPRLGGPSFGGSWTTEFTLPGAARSTVPAEEVLPLADETELSAETPVHGSLADWQRGAGLPVGLPAKVLVRPFDAPGLHAVVEDLAFGGRDGRPVLRPRAGFELQAQTGSALLRSRLTEALSPQGYMVEVSGDALAHVVVRADVVTREVVRVLRDHSLDRTAHDTSRTGTTWTSAGEAGPERIVDLREPNIHAGDHTAANRPLLLVEDSYSTWLTYGGAESVAGTTTRVAAQPEAEGDAGARYLVRLTPRWTVTPAYREKKLFPARRRPAPAQWQAPVTTPPDEPLLVVVDQEGLARLGLRQPADDTGPHTGNRQDGPHAGDPGGVEPLVHDDEAAGLARFLSRVQEDAAPSASSATSATEDATAQGLPSHAAEGGVLPYDEQVRAVSADSATSDLAERWPLPTDPGALARQARVDRPKVLNHIDGAEVRDAIGRLLGAAAADPTIRELVEHAFSDGNLKANFHRALDGGYTADLSPGVNGGPQIVLEAVGLGSPHGLSSGSTEFGFGRTHQSAGQNVSSGRARALLEPRLIRVPIPFFLFFGKIAGLVNHRSSALSSAVDRGGETTVVEANVPSTAAGHTALYRLSIRVRGRWPWSKPVTRVDYVPVDVRLAWPRHDLTAGAGTDTETVAPVGQPKEIEHAVLAGLGEVDKAVQSALGRDFKLNDPAAREFRAWLHQLGDKAPELFGGQVVRKSFPFAGRWGRTPVAVAIADPVVRDLPETEGSIVHTRTVGAQSTSEQGYVRRSGGGVIVGVGGTEALTANIGVVHMDYRLTKTGSGTTERREHVSAETYAGPVAMRRVEFTYVVRVGSGPKHVVQRVDGGAATLWTRKPGESPAPVVPAAEPAGVSRFDVPDRMDAAYRIPDETVEDIAGRVLHRLEAEGLLAAKRLPKVAAEFRAFLRDHARELTHGADGVRFPLSAWVSGAPDVFIRGVMKAADARYLGEGVGVTLDGSIGASHTQNVAVTKRRDRSTGIASAGYLEDDQDIEFGTFQITYKKNRAATEVTGQKEGFEQSLGGGERIHRFDYPVEFQVLVGGRWAVPGEVARWREADGSEGYSASVVPGRVEVVVPERGAVALADPSDSAGEASAVAWQEGPAPADESRYLPAGFTLEALKPVPKLQSTMAEMLAAPGGTKWRELYRRPLLGAAPVPFDQHQGRNWFERVPDELNERNASLDVLESFTSPEARMAGFERAVGLKDTVRLKSHNRAGLAGTRELFARLDLAARLTGVRVLARDDARRFGGTRFGATERGTEALRGWGVRAKLGGGIMAVIRHVVGYFGPDLDTAAMYSRVQGVSAVDAAKDVSAEEWVERGYLVSFDATYEVHTATGRAWQDISTLLHRGTAQERSKWVRVPDAVRVWVPASEIHRIGTLTEADVEKLEDVDVRRYLAGRAEAPSETGHEPGGSDPGLSIVEVPPAVRPPVNVGRGSGRVELYRLEAGVELVQQIARRLDEWSVANGRMARSWMDIAYQLLGRPVEQAAEPPARVAEFDRINDRLVHDVLGPIAGMSGFGAVIEEMLNGGRPLFIEGDTPFGKVEQLVVLRARLGQGGYHGVITGRTSNSGLESTHRTGRTKRTGWEFEVIPTAFWYPSVPGKPAPIFLFGPLSGVHARTKDWEFAREFEQSVTSAGSQDGVQFLHDLVVTMDVYPYARPGHYSQHLPEWMPKLGGRRFGGKWSEEFLLAGSVRSTVPVQEILPAEDEAGPSTTVPVRGSLLEWQRGAGLPVGLPEKAWVRPFDAPGLHAALDDVAYPGPEDGRPVLRPRAGFQLQAQTGSALLRSKLRQAMSPQGYKVEVAGDALSHVTVTVDFVAWELVRPLEGGSLTQTSAEKSHVEMGSERVYEAGPYWYTDLRAPDAEVGHQTAAYRPFGMIADVAANWVEREDKEVVSFATERHAPQSEATAGGRRYLVRLTPRWTVTPAYRDKKLFLGRRQAVPAQWQAPMTTGPDEPLLVEIDQDGLARLGLREPGDDTRAALPAVPEEREGDLAEPSPRPAVDPAVRVVEEPLHGLPRLAGHRLRRTDRAATETTPASSRLELVDDADQVVPDRTVLQREYGGFVVRGPEGDLHLDSGARFEYRELRLPGVDHVVRLREPVGIDGPLQFLDREGVPVEGGRLARFPDGLTATMPLTGRYEGAVAEWRFDTRGVLVRQVLPQLGESSGSTVTGRGKAPMGTAEATTAEMPAEQEGSSAEQEQSAAQEESAEQEQPAGREASGAVAEEAREERQTGQDASGDTTDDVPRAARRGQQPLPTVPEGLPVLPEFRLVKLPPHVVARYESLGMPALPKVLELELLVQDAPQDEWEDERDEREEGTVKHGTTPADPQVEAFLALVDKGRSAHEAPVPLTDDPSAVPEPGSAEAETAEASAERFLTRIYGAHRTDDSGSRTDME